MRYSLFTISILLFLLSYAYGNDYATEKMLTEDEMKTSYVYYDSSFYYRYLFYIQSTADNEQKHEVTSGPFKSIEDNFVMTDYIYYRKFAEAHEHKKKVTSDHFTSAEEIIVTADDGTEVVLQQANIEEMMIFLGSRDRFPNGEVYLVLCPDRKHVLFEIPVYINWFEIKKINYNFDLTKLHEYKNVTAYRFTAYHFAAYNLIKYSTIIWLAKDNDEYCGGLNHSHMQLIGIEQVTEEDKQFYDYIGDAYINIVNDEIAKFYERLDNYTEYNYILINIVRYINYISLYDEKISDEMNQKYLAAIERYNKYKENEAFINQVWLMRYSSPTWQAENKRGTGEKSRKRLPFKGGLPKSPSELRIYKTWMAYRYGEKEPLKDIYGKKIKFKLEKDGLRVSSAGPDGKWNTEDDQTYLFKYSDVEDLLDVNIFYNMM